jgi:hypothetical protein
MGFDLSFLFKKSMAMAMAMMISPQGWRRRGGGGGSSCLI